MTLVGTLSFVDRYLFAILLQPIKSEFRLSDTLVGMLTGFAFALFYVVFSIPISAVADRGRRRAVIVTSILVWSAVTALTGKVTSVLQLAMARFGVGIGEAGVFPTSQAVIADAFPPERRTLAFAILASCSSLGLFIAFSAGGVLEAALGWRQTFLVLGAPGLIVAPLALMAIPRSKPVAATRAPGSGSMFRMLLADARFRHAVLALSAVIMISIGQVQWLPAFFERSFGGTRATIGPALGLTQAAATVTGLFLSGFAGNLLYRYDARLPLAVGFVLSCPRRVAERPDCQRARKNGDGQTPSTWRLRRLRGLSRDPGGRVVRGRSQDGHAHGVLSSTNITPDPHTVIRVQYNF
jgi:MFS family permease